MFIFYHHLKTKRKKEKKKTHYSVIGFLKEDDFSRIENNDDQFLF